MEDARYNELIIMIKNVEDKITSLWYEVKESKVQRKDHEKRIATIEGDYKQSEERFNRIFDAIEKIETNIDKIASAIENIKIVPAKKWDNLMSAVMVALVGGIVGFILSKIF